MGPHAQQPQAVRGLQSQQAAADDDGRAAGHRGRADRLDVLDRPVDEAPRQVVSGDRRHEGPGAGGQDQRVVSDPGAVRAGHPSAAAVDGGHLRVQPQPQAGVVQDAGAGQRESSGAGRRPGGRTARPGRRRAAVPRPGRRCATGRAGHRPAFPRPAGGRPCRGRRRRGCAWSRGSSSCGVHRCAGSAGPAPPGGGERACTAGGRPRCSRRSPWSRGSAAASAAASRAPPAQAASACGR